MLDRAVQRYWKAPGEEPVCQVIREDFLWRKAMQVYQEVGLQTGIRSSPAGKERIEQRRRACNTVAYKGGSKIK